MRLGFAFATFLIFIGCQPNDQTILTVKERLDRGEIIEFSEWGFRHSGCHEKVPNWNLLMSNPDERIRVVAGDQSTIIHPNVYSCYRVGSRVDLEVRQKNAEGKWVRDWNQTGRARITKITWLRIEKLTRNRLRGKFFSQSTEEYYKYVDRVKQVLKDRSPYIALIDFSYEIGSAVDEKLIRESKEKESKEDEYEESAADGKCLRRCTSRIDSDLYVPEQFHDALRAGQLPLWVRLGFANHFRQGDIVSVKVNSKGSEVARVKIKKLKRFKSWALDKYLVADGFDLTAVKEYVSETLRQRPETHVSIIEFELVDQNCEAKIYLANLHRDRATLKKLSQTCASEGMILNAIHIDAEENTLEIPVRVKSRLDDPESTTTTLILEPMSETNEVLP